MPNPTTRWTIGAGASSTLLLSALLLAAPQSHAAPMPTTCQGVPATIVSTHHTVQGTEGRDVIVANSGSTVQAAGGDDLICIANVDGNGNLYRVLAGDGNDVVDTTAVPKHYYGDVDLGAGADRLLGGPSNESVVTDGPSSAEDDHVATGAGSDRVTTGTPGFPNADIVQLGNGDDSVNPQGSILTGPPLDGGSGNNTMGLVDSPGAYAIDNRTGTATLDGQAWAKWTAFDHVVVYGDLAGFSYVGSDRNERVSFYDDYAGSPRSIELAGGNDSLVVYSALAGDQFTGGEDRDFLALASTGPALGLSLASGAIQMDAALAGDAEGSATDFESVHLLASKASLTGTTGPDSLILSGCDLKANGGKGADYITRAPDYIWETFAFGSCPAVFRGGPGRDEIRGSLGNDRLYGGPGRDKIDGWAGKDLCRGEILTKCER